MRSVSLCTKIGQLFTFLLLRSHRCWPGIGVSLSLAKFSQGREGKKNGAAAGGINSRKEAIKDPGEKARGRSGLRRSEMSIADKDTEGVLTTSTSRRRSSKRTLGTWIETPKS